MACMGKTVWTTAMSPGGAHSSRNCRLEECGPPGDVATVCTVFPMHANTCPCDFHLGYAWKRLHNGELHDLYRKPDIIRIVKFCRLRWAGHVTRMVMKEGHRNCL